MNRRWTWGLGSAAVVLLIAALVGAGRLEKGDRDNRDEPAAADAPAPRDDGQPGAPAGGVYRGKTPRLAGTARSIAYEGRIAGVRRVEAPEGINVVSEVFDAQGRSLGHGTLRAEGAAVVEGDLALTGAFIARAGQPIRVDRAGIRGEEVTINAPRLILSNSESPDGRPVSGPLRLRNNPVIDAMRPVIVNETALRLDSPDRTTLSWAGGGDIQVPGHPAMTGQWLGVKAHDVDVTLHTADFRLEGTFKARQVYVDGTPRLKAGRVQVDVVEPADPVPAASRSWFDWAPRNRSDVDMVITRIRPDSPQAAWMNLALDRMPAMFGGEPRQPGGGDTAGLGKSGGGIFGGRASPIDAVILPKTADRESISIDVPAGTPPGRYEIAVVFEGNFDPVRVVIPIDVVPGAT